MPNVRPLVSGITGAALDLLFPRWCIGCGREGDYLCASCRRTLPVIVPPVCEHCGRPLAGEETCVGCDRAQDIDGIRAPFVFDGLIRRAVHELKYHNLRAAAPLLARILHEYLLENPMPGDVLVPVPLHPRRLRERGYNQSALLAEKLGRLAGLPVVEDCLVRIGESSPQARSTGVEERRRNVAGVFSCRDRRLVGRRVILVDDVSTSGATLNAAAIALKEAGAGEVRGLVLALEL